jgi:hypothetical protein
LRAAGWKITRVSISSGAVTGNTFWEIARKRATAALQVSNTRLILRQSRIESSIITSVTENEEFVTPGVRVRFFGRK